MKIDRGNFGQQVAPTVGYSRGPRVIGAAYDTTAGMDSFAQGAGNAGQIIYQEQKQLAEQQARQAADLARIEETTRAQRDELLANEQMATIRQQIAADDTLDTQGKLDRFDEVVSQKRGELEQTYKLPEVRGAFNVKMDALLYQHRNDMLKDVAKATESRTEANINESLDAIRRGGVNDPEAAVQRSDALLDAAGAAAGWDAAKVATVKITQRSAITATAASRRLLDDPRGLQVDLLDSAKYPGMQENERTRLLAQAGRMIEQEDREKTRALEHADRIQERAMKERQAQTAAGARLAVLSGNVGERDLEGMLQRREITLDDFDSLHRALTTEGAGSDDPSTVVNLQRDIPAGIATEAQVMSAWGDGRLSKTTAVDMLGKVDQARRNGGPLASEESKAARRYIDDNVGGVRGPLAVLDTESSQRVAAATREFEDRVLAGEKPRAVSDDIVHRYAPVTSRPSQAPRFLVGGYNDPDIEATRQATAQALAEGRLDPDEAAAQAALLQQYEQWKATVEAQRAAAAAASKNRPSR